PGGSTSTAIWRVESRQDPHAGKRLLRSAAFPGCGLAQLSSSATGASLRRTLVVVSRSARERFLQPGNFPARPGLRQWSAAVSAGPAAAGRTGTKGWSKTGTLALPRRCGWCFAHSRAPKLVADRDDFHG